MMFGAEHVLREQSVGVRLFRRCIFAIAKAQTSSLNRDCAVPGLRIQFISTIIEISNSSQTT